MTDLSELASTVALAGEEGAAVRATVAAKARTIRERMSAESETAAAAVTERMSLPSVLLVLGFLDLPLLPGLRRDVADHPMTHADIARKDHER